MYFLYFFLEHIFLFIIYLNLLWFILFSSQVKTSDVQNCLESHLKVNNLIF